MNPRYISLSLLSCSLLLACCAQAPEDLGPATAGPTEEVAQQPSAPPEAVEAAALPEVRYYLIADT